MDQGIGKLLMNGIRMVYRYAQALVSTATEENCLEDVKSDIQILEQILDQVPGVRDFCKKKSLEPRVARVLCETAFMPYVSPLTTNFLRVLIQNNALSVLLFLQKAFSSLILEAQGKTMVTVESFQPFDPDVLKELKIGLSRRLEKDVILNNQTVPSLLGGFRVLWDNKVLDFSASGRIKKLRALVKNI